jgi:hypothetical protein
MFAITGSKSADAAKYLQHYGLKNRNFRDEQEPHLERFASWYLTYNGVNNYTPLIIGDLKSRAQAQWVKDNHGCIIRIKSALDAECKVGDADDEPFFADITVTHDGTLEELYAKMDAHFAPVFGCI